MAEPGSKVSVLGKRQPCVACSWHVHQFAADAQVWD
ncbi:MAG: hypothetical protein JWQ70_3001 [Aeromicrobium sp.]|nr:hypothetical protein [Aeromicrobium sp.]